MGHPADDVRKSLWTLLGVNNDSLDKVIGISPQAEYDSVLTNWKVPTADGSPHPPSLAQRGQAGLVGRACRVACGMESGTLSLAAPPVASNTSAGDAAASPKKKIKLSSVIDQTNDAEEHLLDRTKIAEAYQRFKTALGDFPAHDEEPTGEQLTALHAVVGSGAPPYRSGGVGSSPVSLAEKVEAERNADFAQWRIPSRRNGRPRLLRAMGRLLQGVPCSCGDAGNSHSSTLRCIPQNA